MGELNIEYVTFPLFCRLECRQDRIRKGPKGYTRLFFPQNYYNIKDIIRQFIDNEKANPS